MVENSVCSTEYNKLSEKLESKNNKMMKLVSEKETLLKENHKLKDDNCNIIDKLTKIQKDKATTTYQLKDKIKK